MIVKEFHKVVSVEEAIATVYKIKEEIKLERKLEEIHIKNALYRVLAEDVISDIDVPHFDRASMDGFAVYARDTFYADEEKPVELEILGYIKAGDTNIYEISEGKTYGIATGAPMPKNANAVVMVEHVVVRGNKALIYKPVSPGENIIPAGSDIRAGELILRKGTLLTSREIALLAAIGKTRIKVYKLPKVAIISTGDEIIDPESKLTFGKIFDINSYSIYSRVLENGGNPSIIGIVEDDEEKIFEVLNSVSRQDYDIILTSGGTSAGVGDVIYKVVERIGKIYVHGIAVKPGKPTVIGRLNDKLFVGLPGYPTSCLLIFDLIVAPILRELAGLPRKELKKLKAKIATKVFSEKGRKEFKFVHIVTGDGSVSAYPVTTGSGAISTFSLADGYITIPEDVEMIDQDTEVEVTLLSEQLRPADLVIIGSHCIGVDIILNIMNKYIPTFAKVINVGSTSGLLASKRFESDISGTHLIDEKTNEYNVPFLKLYGLEDKVYLVRGYGRMQGIVVQKGNPKKIKSLEDFLREDVKIINRNKGSGTRVLLDIKLKELSMKMGCKFEELIKKINGYEIEAKTHSAVAAAVSMNKADAGLAIEAVAKLYDLDFIPIKEEIYDFVIPKNKFNKPHVQKFLEILKSKEFKKELEKLPGFKILKDTGKIIHKPP